MKKLLLFTVFLSNLMLIQAQFQFSGELSQEYIGAKAYLNLIQDYNQINTFLADQIVQETKVDSLGNFKFSGDFLPVEKAFYKIYIDTCHDEVTDAKHLLNHCDRILETTFIASNSDQIHFPINDLQQEFCEVNSDKKSSAAILQLNLLQEDLLGALSGTKSDSQRKSVYNTYFKELQSYAKTYQDPLVELYGYTLYAKRGFPSRNFYLKDLKESTYYKELLERLLEKYPKSNYSELLVSELKADNYYALKESDSEFLWWRVGLPIVLLVSLLLNFKFYLKKKQVSDKTITTIADYKKVLTSQEQKVFELMHEGKANKEIADELFVSLSTIKTHINRIYAKLTISSRAEIKQFFKTEK